MNESDQKCKHSMISDALHEKNVIHNWSAAITVFISSILKNNILVPVVIVGTATKSSEALKSEKSRHRPEVIMN